MKSCKHTFCLDCWQQHLIVKIEAGIGSCSAPCMQAGCNMTVPHYLFMKMLPRPTLAKYWRNLCRQYTEQATSNVVWCSKPGCEYLFVSHGFEQTILCKCQYSTCLKCGLESHIPALCSLVEKWNERANADSACANWIQVHTKLCPKCNRPIQKNEGCNHMTCTIANCGHEFCWVCLSDWSLKTCGFFQCNRY